jgi:hypothetical protein
VMLQDPYVVNRCTEVEAILIDAASWATKDAKLGACLAAYVSVLISGVVEDCIEHLVAQRASKVQDSEIHHYICHALDLRFRNPEFGTISGLLKEFSDEYQQKFTAKISPNGAEATALKSILDNKNSLAHVGTAKLQMTVSDVDGYYRRIIPILETLERILT